MSDSDSQMPDPIYTDISTAFTGTGTLLIHLPSLVSHIRSLFDLDSRVLPLSTYLHAVRYFISNLSLTFTKITFFSFNSCKNDFYVQGKDLICDKENMFDRTIYEYVRQIIKGTVSMNLESKPSLFLYYNDFTMMTLRTFVEEERVSLVLISPLSFLFDFFLSRDIYVGIFCSLEFRLPNTFAFVYQPVYGVKCYDEVGVTDLFGDMDLHKCKNPLLDSFHANLHENLNCSRTQPLSIYKDEFLCLETNSTNSNYLSTFTNLSNVSIESKFMQDPEEILIDSKYYPVITEDECALVLYKILNNEDIIFYDGRGRKNDDIKTRESGSELNYIKLRTEIKNNLDNITKAEIEDTDSSNSSDYVGGVRNNRVPLSSKNELLLSICLKEDERNINKHARNMRMVADSLYGGNMLCANLGTVSDSQPAKISNKNNNININNQRDKNNKKKASKQDEIINENKKRHNEQQRTNEIIFLKNLYARYKNSTMEQKKRLLDIQLGNHSFDVYLKILCLRLEYYFDVWSLERRKENVNESVLVPCYVGCLEVIDLIIKESNIEKQVKDDKNIESESANKYDSNNKKEIKSTVQKEKPNIVCMGELNYALQKLIDCGFQSTALEIIEQYNPPSNVTLDQYQKQNGDPNEIDIYFQLKYAGDKLKRTLNSMKDPRVLFTPDGWQIDLLNIVDDYKSAVVCAPTSSGKTFICFYAIEKILRSSNTDMVIFCLPTKALVNQVSADIYARFSSKIYKNNKVLQGILMPDYQIEVFNCQVLITVPSMLETLLKTLHKEDINTKDIFIKKEKKKSTVPVKLNKKQMREKNSIRTISHVNRTMKLSDIKYIIIDEVHKICSDEMGVPIERIIHLSPCPMIVLSATLGNLDGFYRWMKRIENKKGRDVKLVKFNERYCELKPYIFHFSNNNDDTYKTINSNDSKGYYHTEIENKRKKRGMAKLTPINPLFAFSYQHIKNSGFSNDVSFLPEELLDIYHSIYSVLQESKKNRKEKVKSNNESVKKENDKANNLDNNKIYNVDNESVKKENQKSNNIDNNKIYNMDNESVKKENQKFNNKDNDKIYNIGNDETRKKARKELRAMIKSMRPPTFFKSNIITKKDVKEYEKYLTGLFVNWIKEEKIDSNELMRIYDYLVRDTIEAFKSEQNYYYKNDVSDEKTLCDSKKCTSLVINDSNNKDKNTENTKHSSVNDVNNLNNKDIIEGMDDIISTDNNDKDEADLTKDNNSISSSQSKSIKDKKIIENKLVSILEEDIHDLCTTLKDMNLLPCIIFNMDRNICNSLAIKIYNTLEYLEKEEIIDKNKEKSREKLIKETKRKRDLEPENKKESYIETTLNEEYNIDLLKNDKKNLKYCFINPLYKKSDHELSEIINHNRLYLKTNPLFIDMLYRGIGVHHNGMNKKYRLVVEELFRSKHLSVILSTETLSLGINMPCRSVVFAGDDMEINITNYKQMAGRAGRRGFDTLGHVIFYKMGKVKVQNLMVSCMSELRGKCGMVMGSYINGTEVNSMIDNPLFEIMYEDSNINENTDDNEKDKCCEKKRFKNYYDKENTNNNEGLDTSNQYTIKNYDKDSCDNERKNIEGIDAYNQCYNMNNDKNYCDSERRNNDKIDVINQSCIQNNYIKSCNKEIVNNDKNSITHHCCDKKSTNKYIFDFRDYNLGKFFISSEKRIKLANEQNLMLEQEELIQKKYFTCLSDLFLSNKETDPYMFAFIHIFKETNYLKNIIGLVKDPIIFITILCHFFEVKYTANKKYSLPDLDYEEISTRKSSSVAYLMNQINKDYINKTKNCVYGKELKYLQSQTQVSIFNIPLFPFIDKVKMNINDKKEKVYKNSYILDFFKEGKHTKKIKDSGVGIAELWKGCNSFMKILKSIIDFLDTYTSIRDENVKKAVKEIYEMFEHKFEKIQA